MSVKFSAKCSTLIWLAYNIVCCINETVLTWLSKNIIHLSTCAIFCSQLLLYISSRRIILADICRQGLRNVKLWVNYLSTSLNIIHIKLTVFTNHPNHLPKVFHICNLPPLLPLCFKEHLIILQDVQNNPDTISTTCEATAKQITY